MKHIIVLLIVCALFTATGCPKQPNSTQANAEADAAKTFVAINWLRSNKNTSAFATNRFGPTSAAIDFVENLLASGATQVFVVARFDEPERIAAEGGPYADQLIIQLPSDPKKRAALFRIIATETESEGFDPPQDTGQPTETLWWD